MHERTTTAIGTGTMPGSVKKKLEKRTLQRRVSDGAQPALSLMKEFDEAMDGEDPERGEPELIPDLPPAQQQSQRPLPQEVHAEDFWAQMDSWT